MKCTKAQLIKTDRKHQTITKQWRTSTEADETKFYFSLWKTVPFYRYKSWKKRQMNTEKTKTELKAAVLEGGVRNTHKSRRDVYNIFHPLAHYTHCAYLGRVVQKK